MDNMILIDISKAWDMNEEQLYALLEDDSNISKLTPSSTVTRKVFEKRWSQIKKVVCKFYSDGTKVDGKDLVTAIVAAIAVALKITAGWVIVVVTIAVKQGLGKMCGI
jgi:hypothetical protein